MCDSRELWLPRDVWGRILWYVLMEPPPPPSEKWYEEHSLLEIDDEPPVIMYPFLKCYIFDFVIGMEKGWVRCRCGNRALVLTLGYGNLGLQLVGELSALCVECRTAVGRLDNCVSYYLPHWT